MDEVPPELMDIFVAYIQHVFKTGVTEFEEGQADIVLLTKKHNVNPNEITNKRPIALVKFITKWVHAILTHRIQQHVQHLHNYGFQKEKSTGVAVHKITAVLKYAALHDKPAHMLTVDIEKAYDTVPYALIELMLTSYKCPPHLIKMIMSMHTNRELRFKLNGHVGEACVPERGVAQGSPLSCIIFVMCMQPLLERLRGTAVGIWGNEDDAAYVDDLTLLALSAASLEVKWAIVRSFEQWTGMKINIHKCEYDTTETDRTKWAHLPGVKLVQNEKEGDQVVRILGYWKSASGARDEQYKK
jgi:hypothetical protein